MKDNTEFIHIIAIAEHQGVASADSRPFACTLDSWKENSTTLIILCTCILGLAMTYICALAYIHWHEIMQHSNGFLRSVIFRVLSLR